MITQLHRKGEIEGHWMIITSPFWPAFFRSVRFGAASAHGQANMIRFNFFQEKVLSYAKPTAATR